MAHPHHLLRPNHILYSLWYLPLDESNDLLVGWYITIAKCWWRGVGIRFTLKDISYDCPINWASLLQEVCFYLPWTHKSMHVVVLWLHLLVGLDDGKRRGWFFKISFGPALSKRPLLDMLDLEVFRASLISKRASCESIGIWWVRIWGSRCHSLGGSQGLFGQKLSIVLQQLLLPLLVLVSWYWKEELACRFYAFRQHYFYYNNHAHKQTDWEGLLSSILDGFQGDCKSGQGNIKMLRMRESQIKQGGVVVSRWAHNSKVGGSKPLSAIFFNS